MCEVAAESAAVGCVQRGGERAGGRGGEGLRRGGSSCKPQPNKLAAIYFVGALGPPPPLCSYNQAVAPSPYSPSLFSMHGEACESWLRARYGAHSGFSSLTFSCQLRRPSAGPSGPSPADDPSPSALGPGVHEKIERDIRVWVVQVALLFPYQTARNPKSDGDRSGCCRHSAPCTEGGQCAW